jgi:hypothetical protein
MKNKDKEAWYDKNERLNASIEAKIGMEVVDANGYHGVVVKIVPKSEDFHGTLYVWQKDRTEYGSDNCEHYTIDIWKRFLRVENMN